MRIFCNRSTRCTVELSTTTGNRTAENEYLKNGRDGVDGGDIWYLENRGYEMQPKEYANVVMKLWRTNVDWLNNFKTADNLKPGDDFIALQKKFSYFVDDSTPKVFTASKNKYLIAEPVTYQHKIRQMATVEMKPVYPIVPDSLQPGYQPASLAELDSAARSVIDSTYIVDVPQQPTDTAQQYGEDSVYVITKDKEVKLLKYDMDSLKYSVVDVRLNVDQDNYMWYLRNYLILPDTKLSMLQNATNKETAAKKGKKGIFGFFKNLFKKKHKDEIDSSTLKPVKSEDDFDYIDTTEVAKPAVQQAAPKKKGAFSFLKKDKSKKPKPKKENQQEAVTPEEKPEKKKKNKKSDQEQQPADQPSDEEKKEDGF